METNRTLSRWALALIQIWAKARRCFLFRALVWVSSRLMPASRRWDDP
jgi:hypothetical protein